MGFKEVVILPLARKWIAGANMKSALEDARKANAKGLGVVANFLGEEVKDASVADASMNEYLALQEGMKSQGIKGFASVKLTQFGLGSDDAGAASRLERVTANAERLGQLLWIDMESSPLIPKTLEIYLDLLERHRGTGVALQTYTKRSGADLLKILDAGGTVRLVKGAYKNQPDVYSTRAEVNDNFRKQMTMLFDRGDRFAIATHDPKLVDGAKRLAESRHVDFRFEMLKGIQDGLKQELTGQGYTVFEYLPYGDRWWPYSKRRITEHPSNIWLLLRSLV